MKEFRFAVGRVDAEQSASWKLWAHGNEAYLLQRGIIAKHQKFSFHKSGNCRWAQIDPKLNGAQRAVCEWTRGPIPEAGSGQGSALLSLNFPTNHLSTSRQADTSNLFWIDPAPPGWAVHLMIFVTKESQPTIERLFGTGQHNRLLACLRLRNGAHVCASASIQHCGPVDVKMPGKLVMPGQVFGEMNFPDRDDQNTGRPIRMMVMGRSGTPPDLWELGGYEAIRLALIHRGVSADA